MCLTSPTGTLLEVMSTSGDSSSAFSSISSTATPNTDKNITSSVYRKELTNIEAPKTTSLPNSGTDSADIHLSGGTSGFERQEHNMPPLSGSTISESMENITLQRDVMSFDVVYLDEEGESFELNKKDNAKSAFEITSVRPANTDDHDRSVVRNPVSNDSLRVVHTGKGESGEFEDSLVTADNKQQVLTTDLEDSMMQAKANTVANADPTQDEKQQLRVKNEVSKKNTTNVTKGLNVTPSGTTSISEDIGTGESLAHPVNTNTTSGAGGAVAGNGSSVQPNRFRRVNQYERGRWTVRDSLVTEEQAETTTAASVPLRRYQPYQHQDQSGSDTVGNGLPAPRTNQQQQQRVEQTTDISQFQTTPMLPGTTGGGGGGGLGLSDVTSDKDSSSILMDRSSTAAETLSRNTSLSSIIPEKSVDEDESEVDSISGTGFGAISNLVQIHEQELSDVRLATLSQPPVLATLSVGAVPPPSSTTIHREEQSPLPATTSGESGKESNYDEVDLRRVKNAMSLLQVELDHILTNSSNASLIEENRTLKVQNALMYNENTKLQNDISSTKDKLQATTEENFRLQAELNQLKTSLSKLLAGDTPSVRVEAMIPAGRSDQQTASGNTLSSLETTGTSPSQGFT